MEESNILVWLHGASDYTVAIDQIEHVLTPTIDSVQMFNDPNQCIDFITNHEDETIFMVISSVVDSIIIDAIHDFVHIAIIYVFYPSSTQQSILKDNEWHNKYSKIRKYVNTVDVVIDIISKIYWNQQRLGMHNSKYDLQKCTKKERRKNGQYFEHIFTHNMTSIYYDDNGNQTAYKLLWLDDSLDDHMDLEEKLMKIIPLMERFDNYEECEKAIKELKDTAAVLIVSTSMANYVIERIHQLQVVTKILLHCSNKQEFDLESLLKLYDKVQPILYDEEQLVATIAEDWQSKEKLEYIFQFNIQNRPDRTLTAEDIHSKWYMFFVEHLFRVQEPYDAAKGDLIDYMKRAYRGNQRQIEQIEKFEHVYRSSDAIKWYTAEFCLYRLVNRAFRIADFLALFSMRLFIQDLYKQLSILHEQQRKAWQEKNCSSIRVYRGQYMFESEGSLVQSKHVVVNTFLSTTLDKELAMGFIISENPNKRRKAVLFEIEINPTIDSSPFADVSSMSMTTDEKEIIFVPGTGFFFKSETRDDTTGITTIHLELDVRRNISTERHRRLTIHPCDIGVPLCQMGESQTAETLLLGLLEQLSNRPSELSLCYVVLGYVATTLDEIDRAVRYFETAYHILININGNIQDALAQICSRLAECYVMQKKYESGLQCNTYARELVMESNNSDLRCEVLCNYYRTLAHYCSLRRKFDLALHHYKVSLVWRTLLDASSANLVTSYEYLGHIHFYMEQYTDALKYYQKSYDLVLKVLPITHPLVGNALYNCGWAKLKSGDRRHLPEVLSHFSEAFEIYHYSLPSTNPRRIRCDQALEMTRKTNAFVDGRDPKCVVLVTGLH